MMRSPFACSSFPDLREDHACTASEPGRGQGKILMAVVLHKALISCPHRQDRKWSGLRAGGGSGDKEKE